MITQNKRQGTASVHEHPKAKNYGMIGDYFKMAIKPTLEKVAPTNMRILITGETGTGKELLARAIHKASGKEGKFVTVNCGAIPIHLLESEIFGHRKGAFTGAIENAIGKARMAEGGTLFLDEIGDMLPEHQAKILRFLTDGELQVVGNKNDFVNTRIIAATNHDLDIDIKERRFRLDLFQRLAEYQFKLAPLRERIGDLPNLIEHFLGIYCEIYNKDPGDMAKLSTNLLTLNLNLQQYDWPGNVRELQTFIQQAVVLDDVKKFSDHEKDDCNNNILIIRSSDIKTETKRLEAKMIQKCLAEHDENRTHSARALGISGPALLYKMKEYGLIKLAATKTT